MKKIIKEKIKTENGINTKMKCIKLVAENFSTSQHEEAIKKLIGSEKFTVKSLIWRLWFWSFTKLTKSVLMQPCCKKNHSSASLDFSHVSLPARSYPPRWGWGSVGFCSGCGRWSQCGCLCRSWPIVNGGWPGCPSLESGFQVLNSENDKSRQNCHNDSQSRVSQGGFWVLASTNERLKQPKCWTRTCGVGWWWHRVILLLFDKLEGNSTEVALILDDQVAQCYHQLLPSAHVKKYSINHKSSTQFQWQKSSNSKVVLVHFWIFHLQENQPK